MTWAEQALADLPPAEMAYRVIAGVSLGQAALALGRLDRAERAFADAAAANRAAGLAQGSLTATPAAGQPFLRLRGARRKRSATGQAAHRPGPRSGRSPRSSGGSSCSRWPDALLDANDLDAALPLAMEGLVAPRRFRERAAAGPARRACPVVRLRLAEAVRPRPRPCWPRSGRSSARPVRHGRAPAGADRGADRPGRG